MATFVTLCELKDRVYVDGTDAYDKRLDSLLDHAESAILTSTDYDPDDVRRIPPELFPDDLREAIIQLAAAWFAQPEATAPQKYTAVPYSIAFLVKPFQRMAGGGRLEKLIPVD